MFREPSSAKVRPRPGRTYAHRNEEFWLKADIERRLAADGIRYRREYSFTTDYCDGGFDTALKSRLFLDFAIFDSVTRRIRLAVEVKHKVNTQTLTMALGQCMLYQALILPKPRPCNPDHTKLICNAIICIPYPFCIPKDISHAIQGYGIEICLPEDLVFVINEKLAIPIKEPDYMM